MIPNRPPPQAFRIFVVDDHADILSSVCRQLVRSGHTVVASARNMAEALQTLPQAECEVLLSDIGLPDGTGWELLRKVTPLLSHPLYAIAMSGYSEPSDFEESRKAGFRQHLVKPFLPSELAEALKGVASSN